MTIDYTRPPQPPQSPQPDKTYGCFKWGAIGCALVLVLVLLGIVGLVVFLFAVIRRTDPYTEALHRAQSNPQVIAAIGEPIEAGWWITGSVNTNDRTGEARITFPIKGPKGKATVRVEATKRGGRWSYSYMRVAPQHGSEIDLLASQ